MLLRLTELREADIPRLMAVYVEGNQENGAYFHPDLPVEAGIRLAEQDFVKYLREDFFTRPENVYYVLEQDGAWVAALRLYALEQCYYIEALETALEYRRRGYGSRLLRELIRDLERTGPVELRDCVRKTNQASLRTHFAAGFQIGQDPGVDFLSGESSDRDFGMLYRT